MGQYAEQISRLSLVQQLMQSAGRDDIALTDITKLAAMVVDVADIIGPLLSRIPQTFKQYTEHDIGHCSNIMYLMGKFIPKETLERLNGLEIAVLLLSALLHDFGMVVTDREKQDALDADDFKSFLAHHHHRSVALEQARMDGNEQRTMIIQDTLLAEYFRRLHPQRAATNVQKHLMGKLVFRDKDITPYILAVCESHAWGVLESNDPRHPNNAVSKLDTNRPVYGVPLNLQYLACCLRLADIMDFDRSRTPTSVFQHIEFTETDSWKEWNKHLQISGWSINEYEVMYAAECTQPAFYVAVMEFLDWIDVELRECRQLLVKEAPRNIAERYRLHLPPIVDRWKVEMADKQYLAGAFRFQLEYERILQLLMDKSLYPDPSLFLRELLQNSLDACRNREAIAKSKGARTSYTPRIAVWDFTSDSRDPRIVFQDNGIGMSRRIVEEYFMRVGRSYYRSVEFEAERQRLQKAGIELEATSQFGIGILSCFMVADRFEVETYRVGNKPLHITIEGPTKFFTVRLLDEPDRTDFPSQPSSDREDGPPMFSGTRITIHLRGNANVDVYQVLSRFSVNIEYDVLVYRPNTTKPQKIGRWRWESKQIVVSHFPQVASETSFWYASNEQWTLQEENTPRLDLAKKLDEVLAASRIPFESYSFSRHLKGSAWLWLLRSEDGGVCPQRGYLKISKSLMTIGLPRFIGTVTERAIIEFGRRESSTDAFLELLEASARANKNPFDDEENIELFRRSLGSGPGIYELSSRLAQQWDKLSTDERLAACTSLRMHERRAVQWFNAEGVMRDLLLGSTNFVHQSIDFEDSLRLNALPQLVALHGILLPGGFIRWDPMAGYARRIRLMPLPGAMQVDVRGSNVPRPAASRLFADKQEAEKAVVPFARAVLRHVHALVFQDPSNSSWQEWLQDFVREIGDLYFWITAVWEEFEFLDQYVKYPTYIDETGYKTVHLSSQELVQRFGRWVPVISPGKAKRIGVYRGWRSLEHYLLAFRPKRKRSDGIWELDMENKIMPIGNTLNEAISKWESEMK